MVILQEGVYFIIELKCYVSLYHNTSGICELTMTNKTTLNATTFFKNGSKTERAGLHLYIKYHEAVMLWKKIYHWPLMLKICEKWVNRKCVSATNLKSNPTVWDHVSMLYVKYQEAVICSCWENCYENIFPTCQPTFTILIITRVCTSATWPKMSNIKLWKPD
jgi:hypothetical protein